MAQEFQIDSVRATASTTQLSSTASQASSVLSPAGLAALESLIFGEIGTPVAQASTSLTSSLSTALSSAITLLKGIGVDIGTAVEGYLSDDAAVAAALGGTPNQSGSGKTPPHEKAIPPYNTNWPGLTDLAVYDEMSAAALAFRAKGWPNAAAMLEHYLGNSGTTQPVDPTQIMHDVPTFNAAVNGYIGQQQPGAGSNDSGWINANTDVRKPDGSFGGTQSSDWFYAMHDFRYKVTGATTVQDGQRVDDYTVDVYKPYIFGSPRSDLSIPGITPITGWKQSQDSIQHLHTVGLAQDFVISGSSHLVTSSPVKGSQ